MHYLIEREMRLAFADPVYEHYAELRLAPRDDPHQRLLDLTLDAEPLAPPREYLDWMGNRVHCCGWLPPHRGVTVRLQALVASTLADPLDFEPVPPDREGQWIAEVLRAQPRLLDFRLHRSPATPEAAGLAGLPPLPMHHPERPLLDSVLAAMAWVGEVLPCRPGVAAPAPSLTEALARGWGGCHDGAHLLLSLVRGWGVPARYVVGYCADAPGAGAAAEHAWTEVLIPGAGWRGFDLGRQALVDAGYVAVAVGREHADAQSQRATWKGAPAAPSASVSVQMQQQAQ